jgi:hypothetical protein
MVNRLRVVGVHPVKANEPVHLIEVEVSGDVSAFNFADITQEQSGKPRENWQAAYDERKLEATDGKARFAFFLHYLDLGMPLRTSFGAVALPSVTPVPMHLQAIEYEQP